MAPRRRQQRRTGPGPPGRRRRGPSGVRRGDTRTVAAIAPSAAVGRLAHGGGGRLTGSAASRATEPPRRSPYHGTVHRPFRFTPPETGATAVLRPRLLEPLARRFELRLVTVEA